MERRVNAGSIQAVANYTRIAPDIGHTIALYGAPDPQFPGVTFATDPQAFDAILFILESGLHWMSGLRMARFLRNVPRHRRAVLDADGMYNQLTTIDDYDHNHRNVHEHAKWLAYFNILSDRILQPTPAPTERGVISLPFYGYDPGARRPENAPEQPFDIIHVGHNWWRWREMSTRLLPAIEDIRDRVGEICFVGSWWDKPPMVDDPMTKQAFCVDRARLERAAIRVSSAVPYSDVVQTMSKGRITIMTQRPLLRHLRLLTSKYFEIFCADTIPLVMIDPHQAEFVYGPAGRELVLHDDIGAKLLDALGRPRRYREIVEEVRRHLTLHHSYRRRVKELATALSSPNPNATRRFAS